MLRCLLLLHLEDRTARHIFRVVNVLTGVLLLLPGLYCSIYAHMGLWPLLVSGLLLYKALTAGLL